MIEEEPEDSQEWTGDTWDYRQIVAGGPVTAEMVLQALAEMGKNGWELCSTLTCQGAPLMIFKRRHRRMNPEVQLINFGRNQG